MTAQNQRNSLKNGLCEHHKKITLKQRKSTEVSEYIKLTNKKPKKTTNWLHLSLCFLLSFFFTYLTTIQQIWFNKLNTFQKIPFKILIIRKIIWINKYCIDHCRKNISQIFLGLLFLISFLLLIVLIMPLIVSILALFKIINLYNWLLTKHNPKYVLLNNSGIWDLKFYLIDRNI